MSRPCPVIVMAKAPVPGFAKTRLAPALGNEGVARLGERLLRNAVAQARVADVETGQVVLHTRYSPSRFRGTGFGWQCHFELPGRGGSRPSHGAGAAPGDRRVRARAADRNGLARSDAPYLREAAGALNDHDAVFGPATDGGYTLVGLRCPALALFEGVPWSTGDVMARTRERLKILGMSHRELAPRTDIDEPKDLPRLPAGWLP